MTNQKRTTNHFGHLPWFLAEPVECVESPMTHHFGTLGVKLCFLFRAVDRSSERVWQKNLPCSSRCPPLKKPAYPELRQVDVTITARGCRKLLEPACGTE